MRLTVRLVLSHVLVAVIGGIATFAVVRWLAPALFDQSIQHAGWAGGRGQGQGQVLRDQFAAAVDQSLLIGAAVGVIAAAAFGVFAAYRVIKPLGAVRAATRELARGRYDVPAPVPHEPELGDLARDVNTLADALAQTEARRVRLLGEVAHELRTPLTVIDGYVEGMIDGVLPTSTDNLGQIGEETRRLRRLSEDLSALSRAEEGRLGLERRPCDLGGIARAAAERLRPQAEDAGIGLDVAPAGDPLPVEADPDRIAQVVTNLVGNALRATPAGGRITVGAWRDRGFALVTVSDTGVGLAPDDLERVFERFYRVGSRAGESGSGIGLTISRGIARAHGGDVTAASAGLGQGARFTLALPLRNQG